MCSTSNHLVTAVQLCILYLTLNFRGICFGEECVGRRKNLFFMCSQNPGDRALCHQVLSDAASVLTGQAGLCLRLLLCRVQRRCPGPSAAVPVLQQQGAPAAARGRPRPPLPSLSRAVFICLFLATSLNFGL